MSRANSPSFENRGDTEDENRVEPREAQEMEVFRNHYAALDEGAGARSDSEGEERQLLLDGKLGNKSTGSHGESETEENEEGRGNGKKDLKRDMSLIGMIAFVIGYIIGSGIFITPTDVLHRSGSFGLALIAWVVGAFLAVGGGLSFCELGLLFKNSGGEYVYLKEAYNLGRPYQVTLMC